MVEPRAEIEPDRGSPLREGLEEYAAGRYWNAHERWERVWRGLRGDERHYVQGLIMLAAAAWHVERGRESTARRLLYRAAAHFAQMLASPGLPASPALEERARAAAASARLSLPPVSLEHL